MPKLKPWYKVVTPREDLREGRPLDASEFAVHLDQIRDGRANPDYQVAERFFERTFLTKSLKGFAIEVIRRLGGQKTETSSVFNMATQFGGGKTHALALLYHLALNISQVRKYPNLIGLLDEANIKDINTISTAVFVGSEFDSLQGRGGNDGTPLRKTPWGEIAFQLSGVDGFNVVKEHENQMIAPSTEVIRKFLPKNKPSLILVDELLNYVSRNRKSGLSSQLYNFMLNLSEESRGSTGVVLVVSVPASELEMTSEDQADYSRFMKMLDRLGKPIMMSAETETSEIIRRRLFEWDSRAVTPEGKILLGKDAIETCSEYSAWINNNRQLIPNWFTQHSKEAFLATYPFHPSLISVFERKWQELPRFQRTRGILRILALWVSHAYQQGFKKAHGDSLINLGSAPLDDPQFRSAIFEQLGESRLEGAITADICGRKESHATTLDKEAEETLKRTEIHKKVATVIFFESNGGQTRNVATVPEIRLAVAEPELDIGNVETALDRLTDACYYLANEKNYYRFSLKENLNKRFADHRSNIKDEDINKLISEEIQKVFPATYGVERVFYPEKSGQILDRPVITFVVMGPEHSMQEDHDLKNNIMSMTKEYGNSARTYKSALIWIVPESSRVLKDECRKVIAWKEIEGECLNLDDVQKRQLSENIKKSARDFRESVWRSYKYLMVLGKDNQMKTVDLGLVTSSSAENMCLHILSTLRQSGDIEKTISPRFVARNWPPAFTEWSTKSLRDAFYASPQFPKLIDQETLKETILRGVSEGIIAYVGKTKDSGYSPFFYKKTISLDDIEISEDMFIIQAEEAEKNIKPPELTKMSITPQQTHIQPGKMQTFTVMGFDQFNRNFELNEIQWTAKGGKISQDGIFTAGKDEGNFIINARSGKILGVANVIVKEEYVPPEPEELSPTGKRLKWTGEIPPQKWMNFYTKVLTKYVHNCNLKLNLSIQAEPKDGITEQQINETKSDLVDLGLNDDIKIE